MEPVENNNNSLSATSEPTSWQSLFRKKWVFICIAVILLGLAGALILLQPQKKQISPVKPTSIQLPTPTYSVELESAIDEAEQTAAQYDEKTEETTTEYPWIRTLPLASSKYFVYFDTQKQKLVARIYPTQDDDVEQMKKIIQQELKAAKGIPIEDVQIEWLINP